MSTPIYLILKTNEYRQSPEDAIKELTEKVDANLAAGWTLVGGIAVDADPDGHGLYLYQAMVLHEDDDDDD
jgi:hypothetical protein